MVFALFTDKKADYMTNKTESTGWHAVIDYEWRSSAEYVA